MFFLILLLFKLKSLILGKFLVIEKFEFCSIFFAILIHINITDYLFSNIFAVTILLFYKITGTYTKLFEYL